MPTGRIGRLRPHVVALIRERRRRLAAISRYDRYIAQAEGHLTLQGFWRTLKRQEVEDEQRLKDWIDRRSPEPPIELLLFRVAVRSRPHLGPGRLEERPFPSLSPSYTNWSLIEGASLFGEHVMQLRIRGVNYGLDDVLKDHIERRLRYALGRFAAPIQRLTVRLTDVNGPRGGLYCCRRIAVALVPRGVVTVLGWRGRPVRPRRRRGEAGGPGGPARVGAAAAGSKPSV